MPNSILVTLIVSLQFVAAIMGHYCMPLMTVTAASAPVDHCQSGVPDDPSPDALICRCCLLTAEAPSVGATLSSPEMSGTIAGQVAEPIPPLRRLPLSVGRGPPPGKDRLYQICALLI